MPDQPKAPLLFRLVRKLLVWTVMACVLVFATLLFVETLRIRAFPPLQAWQLRVPDRDFVAKDATADFGFDDYLAAEDALFKDLQTYTIDPKALGGHSKIIRYVRGGVGDPATFQPNWNRTVELSPDGGAVVGGVLLLHGLTDSPYSMRSVAEMFQRDGFQALCLRLPGHGTVPAGLLKVTTEDWMAAVRIAWRHLLEQVGPGKPVYLCGYSNGGALSVLFTLELLESGARAPDGIFLFAPAIGITPFAVASNLHRVYSWIPFWSRSAWLSIEPEYDPFKYNSFPKNAGAQSWSLTRQIERALAMAAQDGRLARMPPVVTFQSLVDATVVAPDLVSRFYARLPANGSELVIFDVNRTSVLDGFYRESLLSLQALLEHPSLNYTVTVVGGTAEDSTNVVARIHPANSTKIDTQPLDTTWPAQVYSLAHVAIPFPPDDVLYGNATADRSAGRVHIGDLSLRGEKNVLTISAADLMRLRHNPFHAFMLERIRPARVQGVDTSDAPPRLRVGGIADV